MFHSIFMMKTLLVLLPICVFLSFLISPILGACTTPPIYVNGSTVTCTIAFQECQIGWCNTGQQNPNWGQVGICYPYNQGPGCYCNAQSQCAGYCDDSPFLSPTYLCLNAIQPNGPCKGLEVNNECGGDYFCDILGPNPPYNPPSPNNYYCHKTRTGGDYCTADAQCSGRSCSIGVHYINSTSVPNTSGTCNTSIVEAIGSAIGAVVKLILIICGCIVGLCILIPLSIVCLRRWRLQSAPLPVYQQPLVFHISQPIMQPMGSVQSYQPLL